MGKTELLVRKAQSGNLEALEELIGQFQDMAHGYAYAILGDFQSAEDVVQEAFIDVYRQLPKLRIPTAFPSWLRRIVFKHCDRMTRNQKIQTSSLDSVPYAAIDKNSLAQISNRRDMREEIMESVRSLPENEKVVTTLFYINGYSQKEIGEFLELPVTTVKKRLYNSRQKLKERMIDMVKTTLRDNVLPMDFAQKLITFPFPRQKPQVEIEDLPMGDLSIHCIDAQAHFVPLVENGKCDWTFYDQPDGRLTGINEDHVINTAMWESGKLFRIWSRFTDYKKDGKQEWGESHYLVEDDRFKRIELKRERQSVSISAYMFPGDKSISTPEPMTLRIGTKGSDFSVTGISKVTIGKNSWKCLKVEFLSGHKQPRTFAEWYVADSGRTVFFRRFNGPGYAEKSNSTGNYRLLEGQIEIKRQGIIFRHWYDCIPDTALV